MAKKENVMLDRLAVGQERVVLEMIQEDDGLSETFQGGSNTITRIANADYSALIRLGNKAIGFVMVVYNGRNRKHEIDMGVLKAYRGKGYGTAALSQLKRILLNSDLDVEIQTRQVNEAAIKSIVKNGFVLCRQDKEYNYYILPKESKKQGR